MNMNTPRPIILLILASGGVIGFLAMLFAAKASGDRARAEAMRDARYDLTKTLTHDPLNSTVGTTGEMPPGEVGLTNQIISSP